MREIDISKFKAACVAVLNEVEKTQEAICVTRHGKPMVQIGPPSRSSKIADSFGAMVGTCEILDDIVSPWTDEETPSRLGNRRRLKDKGHQRSSAEPVA